MTILPENIPGLVEISNYEFDTTLEPHILTDKSRVKAAPCRVCKRPCIVTHFASVAKVACNDHRDRKVAPTKVKEFDRSKEAHVLTDKDKTKEVPCRSCGRPCIVTTFAAPDKVSCNDKACGGKAIRTTEWKKGEDGNAVEIKTFKVFDAEMIRKAMEPSLPYWPDGDKADRAELVELAQRELELREDFAEERARIFNIRRQERKDKVDEEAMTPLETEELLQIQVNLDDAHILRRKQREHMVAKLKKRRGRRAYDEVRDEDTLDTERIPVRRNMRRLEQAMLAG